jgi:hypothetical protein
MESMQRQPVLVGVIAFIVGFSIGLFLFGWGLTPVQYTGAGPQDLLGSYQDYYLTALARTYATTNDAPFVRGALAGWAEASEAICDRAANQRNIDPVTAQQLELLAAAINNNQGCAGVPVTEPGTAPEEEGGGLGSVLLVLLLVLLFAGILGALVYMMRRSGGRPTAADSGFGLDMEPMAAGTMYAGDQDFAATPIARFRTDYERGHDTYDDSFSIENAQGDFLGECGVGISESIGMDTPKNVTAFEVWLFDKNDIRTVTKVIMSDHAFFDEALKAKLAPKGEPILAREGETIVLETATLIVNAEITSMTYGSGSLPPKSFFEQFTVELSAWAKEGDFDEPDIQGHIDEMLDF